MNTNIVSNKRKVLLTFLVSAALVPITVLGSLPGNDKREFTDDFVCPGDNFVNSAADGAANQYFPLVVETANFYSTQACLDEGDCELLEQFQRQVLPLLQIRNLKKSKIRCIPYRQNYNSSRAHYSVLKAMEKTELEENRDEKHNVSSQTTK